MNTAIIVGSSRDDSQSLKVGQYLEQRVPEVISGAEALVVDLNVVPIPLDPAGTSPEWDAIKPKLEAADSFVLITPEWHGMATPALKNYLMHVGARMSHKPTLLVTVSGGSGGANPINELRMSGYKNSRPVLLPDHLIIRKARTVLNEEPDPESKDDTFYRQYIDYLIKLLEQYTEALDSVRDSGVVDLETYPNGM